MSNQFCLACLMPDTGFSVCPHCGWTTEQTSSNSVYLAPGTVVQAPYQVARVLGHGGFGITYLGWDANLQIKVAIKEYLPRDFAMRDPQSGQVLSFGGEAEYHFTTGLQQFLDEARTLAKFQQHAGIVSVLNFFRAFGTGYMVMEYVEGETLRTYLKRGRVRMNWEQTLAIFMHIMDALRAVHAVGLLHRDIAPDNIYLCNDGRIKLLDFGAARQSLTVDGSALAIVKPGFAPEEQYRENGVQGAWSDIYSVAASMYYCLTGMVPPDATERLKQDTLKSLSDYGVVIPPAVEASIMTALAVRASQRPHTVAEFQKSLTDLASVIVSPVVVPQPSEVVPPRRPLPEVVRLLEPEQPRLRWLRWLLAAMLAIVLLYVVYNQLRSVGTEMRRNRVEPTVGSGEPSSANPVQSHDADTDSAPESTRHQSISAEELKMQQEAALKRFEERRRMEPATPARKNNDPSSERNEHLRDLCSEWGATMDCGEGSK